MALLHLTWQPQNHNNNNNQQQRRRRTSAPLGLKNLGNTCYLNSVLQCLTYTPPLAQFCLQSYHSLLCRSLFPNKECPFCIVERQITRSLTWEISPVDSPVKMVKCVNLFAENFRPGRQEDAHEFLRYVIDKCHNSCMKLVKKAAAAPSSSAGGTTSSTVLKEIFGGTLLSQVKCLSCKGESNKTDEMMDISLDLYSSNSLKDALGKFFQPELLEGNNKYNCSKCKNLSVAKKQMFVLRAPNVLVIQLKRFEGIHGGKINRNIEFEEVLLLSKFMYSTSQDLQPAYNLFGSIVHTGFSPDSGHYYAYLKDPSGRWYCCNDAQVTLSSTQEVLSEKVYILFYLRNNPSPRSSKLGSPYYAFTSDSNVDEVSSHQKSAELSKAAIIRTNGVTSKNNTPTVLKNAPQRKLSNKEGDVSLDICTKGTCSSSRNDASYNIQTCCLAHSEELEKFKEVIASEASSELRSCGWVDEVHNYMRARKRLCTEIIGSCPDNTELRRQLIADARKTFLSQIPESLKEHHVERLRLFSQEKPSSDA